MSWGRPEILHWLWAVPVAGLLLWWALRARQRALDRLGPLAAGRTSARAMAVHRGRAVLWLAALALGVVALAQPRWGYRWQELKRQGLDMVVVLDVSSSMDAQDVSPSRMERARREVLDLADLLAGDRVGLVLFARGAYPRMPLTVDYAALRWMVRDSSAQTLLAQGSDLGAAIDMAAALLPPESPADKVILVVSDGEDNEGKALEAADRAAQAGIHIYTIGVGTTDGAPIPQDGGGFKKDAGGSMVLSRLDEDTLQAVARAGSGAYVRSVAGTGDTRALYLDEIRGKLQAAELGVRRDKVWDERYQWPLAGALLLLLAGAALKPGPLRLPAAARASGLAALLLVAVVARGDDAAPADPTAALALEVARRPDDLRLAEEYARALYEHGSFDKAREVLDGVAQRSKDPEQARRARYDAGLAAYRGGQLTQALDRWKEVLEATPDHADSSRNAETVERELQLRMQEEPPPEQQQDQQQQDQQDQQGDTGQDQQQQDQQDQQVDAGQGDTGKPGERGEIQGEPGGEDTGGEEPASTLAEPGEISPEEAARLLDGVEEGTPRVEAASQPRGGKDW